MKWHESSPYIAVFQKGNADEITYFTRQQFYCTVHVADTVTTRVPRRKVHTLGAKLPITQVRDSLQVKSKLKSRHSCMRAKVPWVLLEQYLLEEEYTPQATAKGRGTNGGRQTGIQFQHSLPEKLPTKSSVYTEIVHIPGCLLTWACCIGPPSIHFTRFSLDTAIHLFFSSHGEQSSVMPRVDAPKAICRCWKENKWA